MFEFFNSFSISDWLEFFGILASLITSIIAILISILTLRQNSKMIKESTRPYIIICGKTINCQEPSFYLVLKNYGASGAIITKFNCNYNLANFSISSSLTPFEHICGTFIAPNQSMITNLNKNTLFSEERILKFDIEYKQNNKKYTDHFEIVLNAYKDLIQTRASTKDKELRNISYALQDLVEKHL